ncbi:hypothetical protein BDN70DRAFT_447047 [Pholiota conissans]|uniref:Uncharacterized protein n=1 Tax=Pholiota conissans TaxID=109636 RepID=A0A9P6CNA6_9AGAR|nr:hypothetical protein BDN70DRAFT_447047 [Pholiota conissans]
MLSQSEKQFYLEQAKQLKETFNTRYPDYVYRRRPNNSRKRRRSDAGSMRSADQALPDDESVDLEASPTEGDELLDPTPLASYSRSPYAMSQAAAADHGKYGPPHARPSGHQVSSDPSFRSNGQHESRLSYGGSGHPERMGATMGSNTSPRLPMGHDSLNYPYGQQTGSTASPSLFGTDHPGWQSRVDRMGPPWLGSQESRPIGGSQKQSPFSTTASGSPWSGSDTPAGASAGSSPSNNFFPTLNTPFYPGQAHAPPFPQNISTSPSVPSHSSEYESLGHMQHSGMPRDFAPRGYPSPSSLPSSYPISGRGNMLYSQRILPPVQTGYSHPSQASASSSSSGGNPPPAFWARD